METAAVGDEVDDVLGREPGVEAFFPWNAGPDGAKLEAIEGAPPGRPRLRSSIR